jgi:nucleoporin NUP159
LFGIASSKGLVAAAGPSELVIASTTSIRNAWVSGSTPDNNVKTFNPEVKIRVPRLSHVVFSADENVLVVAGEASGGLAAYSTDGLGSGRTNPALEISTNNQALRALTPNPNVQFAELFAAVTANGDLLMANMKTGQLQTGQNGSILKSGVSCVSWSNQGKQLVAGLADGTAVQMTPDGTPKVVIPRSPSVEGDKHVSTLSWLANDTFLVIYSSNSNSDDMAQPSDYFIVSRQPQTLKYIFQALPEVCPAFGLNRSPACHFIARLRRFEPHLEDLLLLASTTSFELGMITKADAPLSTEEPVVDSYALTMPTDDSRRAQLPLSLNEVDTSPIGLALDLSAKDSIVSPIPSDPEIDQSPGPLPNVVALNHEGVLSLWWIVYADSIREKTTYSGLVVAGGQESTQKQATPAPPQSAPLPPSGFVQPAFGKSGFSAPQSAVKSAASTFGSGSDAKFGSPSPLSGDKPSWTSTGFTGAPQTSSTGFGQSGFGTSTPLGGVKPAFGAPNPFAGKPAFGQPAAPTTTSGSGTAFGQAGSLGARNPNPFSGSGSSSPFGRGAGELKGFASFSNQGQGGFSALASNQRRPDSPFGKAGTRNSAFSKQEQPSPFAPKTDTTTNKSAFTDFGGQGFSIGSTFQRDDSEKNDAPEPGDSGGFSFETGLRDALEQTQKEATPAASREEEMDEGGAEALPTSESQKEEPAPPPEGPKSQIPIVTPPSTISQPKTTPAPPLARLFSTVTQPGTTPAAVQNSKPVGSFDQASSTTPKETPRTKPFAFSATTGNDDQAPAVKTESPSEGSSPNLQNIPEAPLPPDPTSKSRYVPGDTPDTSDESKTSNDDNALPSDALPEKTDSLPDTSQSGPADDEDDDFSSDFEGSVEDETHEISPIDEPTGDQVEHIQTSPESSFGKGAEGSQETSPAGGLFTKVSTSKPSQLFGEVTTGPILPPPVPQESPRSPSPVRNLLTADLARPEASRSVSAPTRPHSASALDRRRAELTKSALGSQAMDARDTRDKEMERTAASEKAKAKAEAEATLRLEDDEDARLRAELEAPPSPSEQLEPFVPHQHSGIDNTDKSGIPGQIERLYRDINSMIDTLGINARSLAAYLLYQTSQEPYKEWPGILTSETPRDALNDEWVLQDVGRFHEGEQTLSALLEKSRIEDVSEKFEQCQQLLNQDLVQLRIKLTSTRKALHACVDAQGRLSAPLSAEQASLQHDLRKASMLVQSKLVKAEQELIVLRAKLAEKSPSQENGMNGTGKGMLDRSVSHKKPTVEAVTSTIAKMTSMAEKKSTDVDVLEAQLKKLGLASGGSVDGSRQGSLEPNGTPQRSSSRLGASQLTRTPMSGTGSVYHTPESKFGQSFRSTPASWRGSLRASINNSGALVSTEDSERWKEKARRKKEVRGLLKQALVERRNPTRTAKA